MKAFRRLPHWLTALLVLVASAPALASTDAPVPIRAAPQAQTPDQTPGITTPYGTVHDPVFQALPGATAHYGYYNGGAYRIEIPDAWNGGLVMYAHGYRNEGPDITVSNPPIRQHLIESGWAWAASSYRGNSYRPDWGVDDTLALRDLFLLQFTQPRETLIYGTSMGGHVTMASLELHPGVYQGALPECGVMTGEEELDYLAAYTAAAEYISGVPLLHAPSADAFAAMVKDQWLPVMGTPGHLTEKGQAFASVVKYLVGGDLPEGEQGFAVRYTADLLPNPPSYLASTPQSRAIDTRYIRYHIDPGFGISDDELNMNVERFDPVPGDRSRDANPVFADLEAHITVPVLSIHTTGDHFVPFSLEQSYRRKAIAAGTSGLLVQRGIRRPNHCQFEETERVQAFDDLVAWVDQGVKPEGDDVLTAAPSTLGLRWTQPLLADDPANR